MRARLLPILIGAVFALVSVPQNAEACGFWWLEDIERKSNVRFDLSTVKDVREGKKARYILRLVEDEDGGLRAERGGKRLYTIDGNDIKRKGKVVGTIDGTSVTFGKKSFEVRVGPLGAKHKKKRRVGAHKFWVDVAADDKTIAQGSAMPLCIGKNVGKRTPAQAMDEIRLRTIFYLAWRER